jgi:predicted RND superfamily exporter protein
MRQVLEIHDYLDGLPETGKVISLGNMMKIAQRLTGGRELDSFELSLIYNEIPDDYRELLITPYVSVENDQVRFFVRVKDSEESLRRNELVSRIGNDLVEKLGYPEESVRLTGMMILYNNMLQSLFDTQIQTLGFVLLVLMVMFLILFRSLRIAVIGIFPNLLSIAVVLSFMGWMRIPLDIMTITIASISVGIAVDDTIHFIYRFKSEIAVGKNYIQAMHRSHNSIGFAMFYTSITIIIGFSILTLSNFIPTILFGLLIGLAMLIAVIGALTLLPALILMIKPFGPEEEGAAV